VRDAKQVLHFLFCGDAEAQVKPGVADTELIGAAQHEFAEIENLAYGLNSLQQASAPTDTKSEQCS
jgi:hypothetical protein